MRTLILISVFCCLAQLASAQCNATITPLGPATFCMPGAVTLKASPGNSYKWFHNGNYIALLVWDTLTVNVTGNYVVVVDSAGCIDTSAAVTVIANTANPQPVIDIVGSDTICLGTSAVLLASLGNAYQWYWNGTPVNGATNDTLWADSAGSYTVIVDSLGCIDTSSAVAISTKTVPPQPGAITGPTDVCDGSTYTFSVAPVPGATSYFWSGGTSSGWQGFYGTTTLPTRTAVVGAANYPYNTPDVTVYVSAVNNCGQSIPGTMHVNAYTPRNLFGMNNDPDMTYATTEVYVCPTSSGVLNAFTHPNSGYCPTPDFQWYRNNIAIPGATGYTYNVSKGGSYKVVLSMGNGACVQTIQKVPVHQMVPNPASVDVLTPQPMCGGGITLLKVNFDWDGFDGNNFNWWWICNDTSVQSNGSEYLPASKPGVYKIGLMWHSQFNTPLFCPSSPVLATITASGNQATPVSIAQNGMTLSATPGFSSYQWFRNNVPITGATSQTHTMTTWGDYFVLATDGNDCVSKSNVVLDVETSASLNASVAIYPNPVADIINIRAAIPSGSNELNAVVFDVSGRRIQSEILQVKNGIAEAQIILADNLAPGLYYLRLTSENYNKVSPFVKQ